MLIVCSHLAA